MADQSEANPADGDETLVDVTGADDAPDSETIEIDADDELDPVDPDNEEDDGDDEEVDFEGGKYRVPKVLKDALLRQADYTKKTMELADLRKATDAEKATIAAEAARVAEHVASLDKLREQTTATLADRVKLQAVDDEITIYAGMTQDQWADLNQRDPAGYQAHRDRYTDLRLNRNSLAEQLAQKETAFTAEQKRIQDEQALSTQQATAKRLEEGRAVLARDIPDWGPELRGKLVEHGQKALGFTAEEILAVEDPRLIKLLHRDMTGHQSTEQRKTAANVRAATAVTPARTVGGATAPVAKNPERMTDAEWMEHERKRLAGKALRQAGRR